LRPTGFAAFCRAATPYFRRKQRSAALRPDSIRPALRSVRKFAARFYDADCGVGLCRQRNRVDGVDSRFESEFNLS